MRPTRRLCRSAACIAAMLASLPAAADFGPRTKVGSNYQQTSNTTSDNAIDLAGCIDTDDCFVLFQPAPQNRPLVVRHVSCRVNANEGEILYGYLRSKDGTTFPFRLTALVPVAAGGGWWNVNAPVLHLLTPGERAIVRFTSSEIGSWVAECTVSGDLY